MKRTMKRLFAVLLLCMVLSIPAWAQTESGAREKQTPQQGTTMPGQMGTGMTSGQQMMEQMSSTLIIMIQNCQKIQMMTWEILSTMKDMVKMQEKMLANPNASEKQQMVQDMTYMMERIDRYMSMMNQMMGGQMMPMQQKQSEPEKKEMK